MRSFRIIEAFAVSTALLGACAPIDGSDRSEKNLMGPKALAGTIAGAGLGAYGGNQFGRASGKTAMTIFGGLLGASAGYYLGSLLDEQDRKQAAEMEQKALAAPVGTPFRWNNPNSGNQGAAISTRQGTERSTGQTCRELVEVWEIQGQEVENVVLVCRNADGSWSSR
ncbi:17 kD surface antigen [Paramagnetospirillum caucaseum]|uniref:17 kDa surface antigen n=1 Tax=Paramagnetospirillum caucaseum TaxID=1244869 RepID=M2ZL90_9PROT|nr:glycine zipper 2TM domain-containing protein [Paramagnetospirillum caucaseum]EME68047.1 17 kD surface antigen [Paramagnetospirillum caucaseum]